MTKRKYWLPAALSLILILACAAFLPPIEMLVINFPEILLGQVALARETKPLSPRAYQSAEFILNQVALSEIERAVFIALHEDALFWDPQYVGFPSTTLNAEEISAIQQWLSAGALFHQAPDGNSFECVTPGPLQEPALELCAQGKTYMDRYMSQQWEAEQDHTVGVLQFFLTNGRLAEIRIYRARNGLAYTPYEKSGDWWFDGVTAPSPLLDQLAARVTLQPVLILWPELTAAQANTRATRFIGNRYQTALELVRNSSAVRELFGDIQELRPAAGNNYYSSWMDSTSVFLTFRVTGTRGEGAVIVQGYDCFDLQMVFQGIPVDAGTSSICP